MRKGVKSGAKSIVKKRFCSIFFKSGTKPQ